MGYTYYNPLKVWLDPASIPDVVAHIQEYLTEYPLINQSDIEQIVVDYITAHPELVGGVDSVNGKTGEVVLTASDINTTNNTTIQAVINSLSADIADIVQSVTTLSGRVTANETGITNEATARANADTALGNRITALQGAVGSPLVASTAAAMTDTSKIYVYTGSETGYTNGNWYYYNGSAWASGGVYNSTAINTDTTLTIAGMAADAKATGDGLNDLKSNLSGLITIESGTFADADGKTKIVSARRARNANPVIVKQIQQIVMPSGYNMWWFALDKSMNLISNTSAWVNELTIATLPAGTVYLNFAIRNQSAHTSDISSEVATIQNGLVVHLIYDLNTESIDALSEELDERVARANLFNGNTHSGIPSQTIGAVYGAVTASDSYFYTDLIPIRDAEHFYVIANFAGLTTVYVTFYDTNKYVVGSQNGNNPALISFPTNAAFFCVCAANSQLSTLMISENIPDNYYNSDSFNVDAVNKATIKYKRIDRGMISGYYPPRTNAGNNLYALSASDALMTSYLVPVYGMSAISYRNIADRVPAILFVDSSLKVVSREEVSGTTGTITIPNGAVAFVWYASTFDAETGITFVAGSTPPNEIYSYSDLEIEGLNADSTEWNPLYGKKILFTGDSITAGSSYDGGWVTLIRNAFNCETTNEGHDGWTICPLPNRTDNLMTLLTTLTGDYNIVALSGGYNDFTVASPATFGEITPYTYSTLDTSTFCGALEQYVRTAKAKWKTAKICYILTMKREYNDISFNTLQKKYWDAIREACEKYAIPLIDLYKNSGLVGVTVTGVTDEMTTYYYKDNDGTHPNTAGYNFLYPKIARFMMTL